MTINAHSWDAGGKWAPTIHVCKLYTQCVQTVYAMLLSHLEDIHARYSSKMEGFQSHLGAWFPNTLCPYSTYCRPWLNTRAHKLVYTRGKELFQLSLGDPLNLVENYRMTAWE